jgi:hypothetical protein
MATHPAEFALDQSVLLYLDGQECRTRITARWFDPDAGDWFYEVAGLAGCEIPAYSVHAL